MVASARWVSAPVATWDKLSDGGSVSVPLEKQMWADAFGMCTDKFGITWMVDISEQQTLNRDVRSGRSWACGLGHRRHDP